MMTQDAKKLLDEALKLPADARAELVGRLLRSLDEEESDLSPKEYEAAWSSEIERRLREVDEGRVQPASWEDARRRIVSDDDDSSPR
jgi:putative addiction module component (TIGR02574 family)